MKLLKTKRTLVSLVIHNELYICVIQKTDKNYSVGTQKHYPPEHAGIIQNTIHNPSFLADTLFTFLEQQKIKKIVLAITIPQAAPEYKLYYELWSTHYGIQLMHIGTHDLDHEAPDESYCAQIACALWQGDGYGQ